MKVIHVVPFLLMIAACGSSATPDTDTQRAGYESIYGEGLEEGFVILQGVCDGDENSDAIFVAMAQEKDDDRSIRALRLMCPEFVDEALGG